MPKRLGLALATLAAGGGLLAAAALGSGTPASPDDVLRIGAIGNLDSIDPAIAYSDSSWMFEAATSARLFRSPDAGGGAVPEVVKRFTVSKNGRVYRFHLRKSYRFSDGEPVRPGSFAYAIKRALNRALGSPGGAFIDDPNAVNILGAKAYAAGTANGVSGVRTSGLTLTIRLVRANPNLPTILTMPFFQAASSKLPLTEEKLYVTQVGDLPTAGPYTWSYNVPNQHATIVRNPYYIGTRGRHLAGVDFEMRLDRAACFQQTLANQLDLGCVPPGQAAAVAQQYGVSRRAPVGTGRFWVRSACESAVMFNHHRSLFAGNAALRQAVNWALDRTALAGQLDPYSVTPWTHLLPPDFPGSVTAGRLQPYSLHANLAKARQLAAGHTGDGNISVAYQSAGRTGPLAADAARQALIGIGFDPSRIEMHGFAGFDFYLALGRANPPFDLAVGTQLCPEYPDPASLIGQALNMRGPFGPASPAFTKAFNILSRTLKGKARIRALGRFDLGVTKSLAPVAMLWFSDDLSFFSDRVDPASLEFAPGYRWSLTALRLK